MTWVKLSDNHTEDPRWRKTGPLALALNTAVLCYCNRNGTDGRVDLGAAQATALMVGFPLDQIEPTITALVAHGFWSETEDGYELVGFLEDQPSAEEVAAKREFDRQRKERLRLHNKNDHSLCDPERCWSLNGKGRPSGTPSGTPHGRTVGVQPSRPESDPTPREERTKGGAAGAGSRFASPAGGSPREGTPIFGPPPGTVVRVCGKAVTAA